VTSPARLIARLRVNYRPVLSPERAPILKKGECLKITSVGIKKSSSLAPDNGLIPGQTGRLTVGRKITLIARVALVIDENLFVSWSRVAVAKVRGQFGNPDAGERPPLETVIVRLVRIVTEVCSMFVCVCVCATVSLKVKSRIVSRRPVNLISTSNLIYSHFIPMIILKGIIKE
jgi:hypothetical protein